MFIKQRISGVELSDDHTEINIDHARLLKCRNESWDSQLSESVLILVFLWFLAKISLLEYSALTSVYIYFTTNFRSRIIRWPHRDKYQLCKTFETRKQKLRLSATRIRTSFGISVIPRGKISLFEYSALSLVYIY